ncbi:MAG: tetraacyldisaccharide 4'-kinase [bacterium]|nr:tetraacyldisaccharide 4'-kinase [bacterium]
MQSINWYLNLIHNERPTFIQRILRLVLYFLSLGYTAVITLRVWLYRKNILKRKQFPIPVISVGNITVGGTGKTPVVRMLAEYFNQRDIKVAILSRGYKKQNLAKVTVVSDYTQLRCDWKTAGDEPYLLAKSLPGVPIIVGRKRKLTGEFALKTLQPQLFILDDGFSHLSVHRTLDIVLIDATNPFDNSYCLPRGLLRESITQLSRADAIIVTKTNLHKEYTSLLNQLHTVAPDVPIFLAKTVPVYLSNLRTQEQINISQCAGQPVIAFAGIAQPQSFLATVRECNLEVKRYIPYPDHYVYRERDIATLIDLAKQQQCTMLITTLKDAVKLCQLLTKSDNDAAIFFALEIRIAIQNESAFYSFITEKIALE